MTPPIKPMGQYSIAETLSACQHARETGHAIVVGEDFALVITRHPTKRPKCHGCDRGWPLEGNWHDAPGSNGRTGVWCADAPEEP